MLLFYCIFDGINAALLNIEIKEKLYSRKYHYSRVVEYIGPAMHENWVSDLQHWDRVSDFTNHSWYKETKCQLCHMRTDSVTSLNWALSTVSLRCGRHLTRLWNVGGLLGLNASKMMKYLFDNKEWSSDKDCCRVQVDWNFRASSSHLSPRFTHLRENNQRFMRLLLWKLSLTVLWIFVSHKGMFTKKWKFCHHHHLEVVFSKYWSDAMSSFEDELKWFWQMC